MELVSYDNLVDDKYTSRYNEVLCVIFSREMVLWRSGSNLRT
jgi:hypothetical protein